MSINVESKNGESKNRDDARKVQWVSGYLTGAVRSLRNYTRIELLETMVEVLNVVGWLPGCQQSIPIDKFPKRRKRSNKRKLFMGRSPSGARRFAQERRDGHYIERRIYPVGFERSGGARLPRQQRREALEEIERETKGVEPTRAVAIVQRIVLKKWREVVPAPADATNFTFGLPSVTPFHDPEAQSRARRMLVWVPTCPQFAGVLDSEEATVWALSFSGVGITQVAIAERIGKGQSLVSKMRNRSVRKLNERYRELRDRNEIPIEIRAWIKTYVGDDSVEADLYRVVELLRRRDRALTKGLEGEDASTGCEDLDKLSIRNS